MPNINKPFLKKAGLVFGFKICLTNLADLSEAFGQKLAFYQKQIFTIAGSEFNLASPKQLATILFDKLGLDSGKKTAKTKSASTSHEVLEKLASQHPIAQFILNWRHFAKLKNTYTDVLPKLVDQQARLHTTLINYKTSTGRLSSLSTNLQNIPIRSEEGDQIRAAFIAEPGKLLVAADYSQIELRLLAHYGKIESLIKAFKNDQDIHRVTASEVFKLPTDQVTSELRRKAKTINFGIIYGISAFGLAERLALSTSEAKAYISAYFAQYPEIKNYMDDMIELCRKQGYVETIYRRKLHFPNINSKNYALRSLTERAVINAPLQGSAAELIKKGMLKAEQLIKEASLNASLLLQVHDELIYEITAADAELLGQIISQAMAEVCPALQVPLKVEAKIGKNWQMLH